MVDKKKIYNILKRYRIKAFRTTEEPKLDQMDYPISREMLAEFIAEELKE